MEKNKLYDILNNIHAGFWIATLILSIVSFKMEMKPLMYLSGSMFVFSGLWTYATYLYFRKAPFSWLSEHKGIAAIVWTIFEGTIVLLAGVYILTHI